MKKAIYIVLLVIICIFSLFVGSRMKPIDIMESRNLATAREMIVYHNYFEPTLNGDLRLEKPPLPTWGAAAVEKIFPGSIGAQRGLTGIMGTMWVVFTFLIAIELGAKQRQSFWIGVIMATCYSVMFMSRNATWDIWCHAMMSVAIWLYIKGIKFEHGGIKYYVLSGAFMGLSFLSKGPVAFYALLLPFLVSYHFIFMPRMSGKWGKILLLLIVMFLISFVWYGYLMMFSPEHFSYVLDKETSAWANHSIRPWYYYYLFFTESGIWCLFWLASLVYTFAYAWYRKDKILLMSAIWSVLALILLSIPPEKKTRYLLPLMMPCAMCVGNWMFAIYIQLKSNFTRIQGLKTYKIISTILAVVLLVLGAGILVAPIGIKLNFGSVMLAIISFALGALCLYTIYIRHNSRGLKFSPNKMRIVIGVFVIEMCVVPLFGMNIIDSMLVNKDGSSIKELRAIPQLDELNVYYPSDEELRPEIMYAVGKRIYQLQCTNQKDDKNNSQFCYSKTEKPYVILISKDIDEYPCFKKDKVTLLSTFNINWQKSHSKQILYKNVYLVE